METLLPQLAVIILAALGLLISAYFLLVYYKFASPNTPLVPKFCRLDERTCETILHTPDAQLAGIPNFYPGIIFYILVIVFGRDPLALHLLIGISAVAVLVGIYLSYTLIVKLKTPCVLCFTSHTINVLIALSFLAQL